MFAIKAVAKRLNVANQQHRGAAASPVRAANGWEGSLPDTFRQTERKGSAKPTGDERSHPASEGGFALHANPCKGAYAPALM